MSCDRCARQAALALESIGVSPSQSQIVFAKAPHVLTCPACGHLSAGGTCPDCRRTQKLADRRGGAGGQAIKTSLAQERGNLYRCRACGRYASLAAGHTCPVSGSPADLARAVSRRIGGNADALYGTERIAALFAASRRSQSGAVKLTHPYSGAALMAELDALPVLMQAGYLPQAWASETPHRILGKNGRIYRVCAPGNLPPAPAPKGAVAAAGQAYGLEVAPDAPVVGAAGTAGFFAQQTIGRPASPAAPAVIGGEEYDVGRIMAYEFADPGQEQPAWPGSTYKVGDRIRGEEYYSPRRLDHQRKLPLVVGRSFPEAAFLAASGSHTISLRADGAVEVYHVDDSGETLQAVYDARTRTAGTLLSSTQADVTPAQILAYLYAEGDESLRQELDNATPGSELRLADSIYLFTRDDLVQAGSVYFGGVVSGPKCPDCGRFVGSLPHACPAQAAPPVADAPVADTPPPEPAATPTPDTPAAKDVRPGSRAVTPAGQLSPQEVVVQDIVMAAPDPWLSRVPAEWGGRLSQPLRENVPAIDPAYTLDAQAEKILAAISASLQIANEVMPPQHAPKMRSFGIYGPSGTGKNALARQLAASLRTREADGSIRQGINYLERTVAPDSTAPELIGATVLEATPEGGTRSRVALGPIGMAAAMGSVICVNEIARNPKLASAFQSMIEDGVIEIQSPEAGIIQIPVHPATVFIFTWNPGYEGDADRPAQAPLSRMATFKMDVPSDEEVMYRAAKFMEEMGVAVERAGAPAGAQLRNSYRIPSQFTLTQDELAAAKNFWRELQKATTPTATQMAKLGGKSLTPTTPGQREFQRFLLLGKAAGWESALETFKVVCDQDEDFPAQWAFVRERYGSYFGF